MRSLALVLIGSLVLAAGCTVRPPPIKSPPTAVDPAGGTPECTWSDGIDSAGNPSCSEGCTWDAAQKRCAPLPPPVAKPAPPAAKPEPPPATKPEPPPNGV